MELNSHVVGIIRGIELGDVEQALSSQTVAKVSRIKTGPAVDGELPRIAIFVLSGDVHSLGSCQSRREKGEENDQGRSERH